MTDAAAPDGTSTPDEWVGINNVTVGPLVPTAAGVSISGRVITPQELGLVNASVTLTDLRGESRTTLTRKFGSFYFANLTAGEIYVISIGSRRYTFMPQIVSPMEDLTGLIFSVQ
jgi:hypothetical protein